MTTSKVNHNKAAKSKKQITGGRWETKKVCHRDDALVIDVQVVEPSSSSHHKAVTLETRVDKVQAGPANDSYQITSSPNSSFIFQAALDNWHNESPILRDRNYQDENALKTQPKRETKNFQSGS